MNVGFIGAGKVGCSLARYFLSCGIAVSGLYGRHGVSDEFPKFDTAADAFKNSDIILVTVTDSAIADVWNGSDKELFRNSNKILCHCSGSLSSEIFTETDPSRISSLHPMLAFPSKYVSPKTIASAFFTIEGGNTAVSALKDLINRCGNPFKVISREYKAKYHAAACFASNFMTAVCADGFELLEECGFSRDEARAVLTPLISANAQNICRDGIKASLTGPAARGDAITVEKHMAVLSGDILERYKLLTKKMAELAGHTEIFRKEL